MPRPRWFAAALSVALAALAAVVARHCREGEIDDTDFEDDGWRPV